MTGLSKCAGLLLLSAIAMSVHAIGIGSLTTEIQENEFFVTKQVKNDDKVAKFVSIDVKEIDNPKKLSVLPQQRKDILVSPAMLFLSPRQAGDVKIYYQGPRDDKERYYQLAFIEQGVSAENNVTSDVSIKARQKVRLASILVVRPRRIQFAYDQDGTGKVHNRGNTFVRATATGKCKGKGKQAGESVPCSVTSFLLPGETANLRNQEFVEFAGIGIWRGNEYRFYSANGNPKKVTPH